MRPGRHRSWCRAVQRPYPLEVDRDHSNNVAQILVNPTVPANGLAATGNRVGLIVGLRWPDARCSAR